LEVREHPPSMQKNIDGWLPGRWGRRSRSAHYQCKKNSMAGPLGGSAGGPRAPAINTKNVDGVHPERCCQRFGSAPHPRKKMSTGGEAGGPGAPAINTKNIDGRPQGGGVRGPGAPTINTKNVEVPPWEAVLEVQECLPSMPKNIDDRPHGRRCQRSESAHHQCKKH
jgi:hypothetical protein